MTVLRGARFSDTIESPRIDTLEIEIRGLNGRAAAGLPLSIRSGTGDDDILGLQVSVFPGVWSFHGTTGTDGDGRARLLVRAHRQAGPARVLVEASAIELKDSVRFTVLPGAPVGARISPADTTVTAGETLALRGVGLDRLGNERHGAFVFDPPGGEMELVGSDLVRTTTPTRARITGHTADAPGLTATAMVSVVPTGELALNVGSGNLLVVGRLDGSGMKPPFPGARAGLLRWSKDGKALLVVYHTDRPELWQVSADGAVQRTVLSTLVSVNSIDPSSDGTWVYSAAFPDTAYRVVRYHLDGSGMESIPGTEGAVAAAISPDGNRLAFSGDDFATRRLSSRNLSTGETRQLANEWAREIRWSPDGRWIAYVVPGGGLRVIPAEGGAPVIVEGQGTGPDWSGDSKWLIAGNLERLYLLEITTGSRIPITTIRGGSPAWRP